MNLIFAIRRFLAHRGGVYVFALGLLLLVTFVPAESQVAVVLAPVPQLQFFDQSGNPLAFGCVFTYQVASTNNLATYTDYSGNTQNQNPVILSAGGSANIWLQAGQAYSFRVKSAGGSNCSSGSTLYTVDGIGGGSTTLTTVVPFSATPSFQVAAQNQLFTITLTGNASAQPLTFVGVTPPGWITFQITQDGSGAHTFSWPANSVGGCTIGAGANQVTTQEFVYNGANATAVGPCVTGNGPIISAGNIFDFGLTASSALCTDANKQFTSSCSTALNLTINGQTLAPGGTGNVNVGAAAHSLALNEGNGNPLVGVTLGADQVAVGKSSADPTGSSIPNCTDTAGNHLNYAAGGTFTCGTSTPSGVVKDFSVSGCSPPASTDGQCNGTITIPVAFADASYFPTLTVNATAFCPSGGSCPGPFLSIEVAGALAAGSIPYNITCTFGCAVATTNTIYIHATHP
jgi:hypothetical protein